MDSLLYHVIPPALGFVVFICLALTAFLRGRRKNASYLFAGFCLSGALINIDIVLVSVLHDKSAALRIDRMIYLVFVFSIPVYIRFIHSFLGLSRRWLDYSACALSLIFLFFTQTDLFISGLHDSTFGTIAKAGPVYHVFCAVGAMAAAYCICTLFHAMKTARENRQKNRIKYILLGMGLSTFLLLLNYLPISGFNIYPMGNFGFIPAIILAFGVLKYDLFDMDAAIRKGMIYLLLTASLAVIYAVFFLIFNVFFKGTVREYALLFPFLLALAVVFLFDPVRAGIQNFTDRHFFMGKYDYRKTLKEISGKMTLLLRYDDIRNFLIHSIRDAVQVENACLVVRRDRDDRSDAVWGTGRIVDVLERIKSPLGRESRIMSRMTRAEKEAVGKVFEVCDAAILFPVIFRDRLTGVIALSEKKSGELFVHEDLELLSTVANQCAVALENACAYEEIEDLNVNLENRVRERTAELARALREKAKTQDRLIQSERLAAIGQLVAGVAHEINNPLASASSLVETSLEYLRKMGDCGFPREAIDEIIDDLGFSIKELERVRDIVRSLLDLSRRTETCDEQVNLNAVIEDALRVLHNQYKRLDVRIEKDFQEDLPRVEGNYAHLGQVFVNVIKNAFQSLPKGKGTIRLMTRQDKENEISFECRDDGKGISPGDMKNIFQPFFTTKEAGKGTGLGLYISYEIVKRHGGNIGVSSVLNEGAAFRIELPVRQVRVLRRTT